MLISWDWLNDFVDLEGESSEELRTLITLGSAEIESIQMTNLYVDQVQVVEVLKTKPHPSADRLQLVKFQTKKGELEVVCGAKNVVKGMKTFYAPLGTTLPNGLTLESKKIRGILSEGMLCSEEELTLPKKIEGIIELPSETPLGQTFGVFVGKKGNICFDIDNKSLTHRPDMWGHFGFAREVAALLRKPLKNSYDKKWEAKLTRSFTKESAPVDLFVEEDSACLEFWGLSVTGVKVKSSPPWLKNRLEAVGLNPINNLVDISNYVMLELGMPLHFYDRRQIEGKLAVKSLKEDKELTGLDEQSYKISKGQTIIFDSKKPLVIAGVMGGISSVFPLKLRNYLLKQLIGKERKFVKLLMLWLFVQNLLNGLKKT